jgi:hypothetical protein
MIVIIVFIKVDAKSSSYRVGIFIGRPSRSLVHSVSLRFTQVCQTHLVRLLAIGSFVQSVQAKSFFGPPFVPLN